ncbi:MAG: FGGY family carbohydrate kinase [Terracidiphilus sp.]|jgi:rhamnulokinase
MQEPARIAIDLGAESCRVSLLRWINGEPEVATIHRIPNGPVHRGRWLCWPLQTILNGLEEGLRKAAAAAPEGIASIAVDSWSVDYVRLAPDGSALHEPFCYRDERTVATKAAADAIVPPLQLYQRTGVHPNRLNTIYQLLADPIAGHKDHIDPHAPWVMMPEYVLYWLGGRRAAEYTNASHTGLVDLKTGNWDRELFRILDLPVEAAPPIVHAGANLGPLQGPLASLDAFRHTQIIAPATHDTASAIAGIRTDLSSTVYICSGTWSLLGTLTSAPVTTREALDARYTNLGAATGDHCFHTLINSMWLLKQCMESWSAEGRPWEVADIVRKAADCKTIPGVIDVDAEPLLLDSDMPERINHELWRLRLETIPDVAGNEPIFARVIFESLAARYARSIASLESMMDRRFQRIHILGGASRNKLLTQLTEERTGLPVEIGHCESSTIGNLAVQLASSEAHGEPISAEAIRKWATVLCNC